MKIPLTLVQNRFAVIYKTLSIYRQRKKGSKIEKRRYSEILIEIESQPSKIYRLEDGGMLNSWFPIRVLILDSSS